LSPESRLADFIARYPPEIGALAQGGIAAAVGPFDTLESHVADTLDAGEITNTLSAMPHANQWKFP
jgi:aspartate oxidase